MYLSTAWYHLPPYSRNESPLSPSPASGPLSSAAQPPLLHPNKDSARPLPRPLRRPGPASFRCLPGTFLRRWVAPIPSLPGPPRSGPARSWASHTLTASFPTSGWWRRWRRVPRQREPYKMATAARASARPGAFSRASSRTRECALPASPPPRRSGATNPAAAHNCPPRAGAGSCGDGTAERRSARPQSRLANHRLGRGSRLARQKGSGSNHCLGKTVRPGGVSQHHNGSWC